MEIEKIEHLKKRTITIDDGYSYSEAIKTNDSEDYIEFLTLTKQNDYSFYYFNGTFQEKIGMFTIEPDSIFIKAFFNLIGEDKSLRIQDDYSEKFIEFSKSDSGEVIIFVHLLPGEIDGTIELKNVMHDFRSQVDIDGMDTKERLSRFFDQLIGVVDTLENDNEKVYKK